MGCRTSGDSRAGDLNEDSGVFSSHELHTIHSVFIEFIAVKNRATSRWQTIGRIAERCVFGCLNQDTVQIVAVEAASRDITDQGRIAMNGILRTVAAIVIKRAVGHGHHVGSAGHRLVRIKPIVALCQYIHSVTGITGKGRVCHCGQKQ